VGTYASIRPLFRRPPPLAGAHRPLTEKTRVFAPDPAAQQNAGSRRSIRLTGSVDVAQAALLK